MLSWTVRSTARARGAATGPAPDAFGERAELSVDSSEYGEVTSRVVVDNRVLEKLMTFVRLRMLERRRSWTFPSRTPR